MSFIFTLFKEGIFLFREPHESRLSPAGIEGDILLFFREFKKAIDTKNLDRLNGLIAKKYYSESYYPSTNKSQLMSYFKDLFNSLPFFINPSLEIEICKTPEITANEQVFIVIRPILNIHILGINLSSQGFGEEKRMRVILEKNKKSCLFGIVNMEDISYLESK